MWRQTGCAVAALSIIAVGACNNGSDKGAQSAPHVTRLSQGPFDDVPLLPRSEPFGARSKKNGVTTQSFRATGYAPAGVIEFYERELPHDGWTRTKPAYRAPTNTRGDWVNEDWRLEVSATAVKDRANPASAEAVVQYSLVLRPRSTSALGVGGAS